MEQVTITREWHSPEITTKVCNKEISLSITLDDYLIALAYELGSPAFLFSKNTLLNKMKQASEDVITAIKKESIKVV